MVIGKSSACVCLLLVASFAAAQTWPFPEQEGEAPSSVFVTVLDGPDATLELSGFWIASAFSTFGFLFAGEASSAATTPQPFLFTQIPDLKLRLTLFDSFFIEGFVGQEATDAKYALGFRDEVWTGDFEVRVGNFGLYFPELPFLSLGDGASTSFGAAARYDDDATGSAAVVRYEQSERREQEWLGASAKRTTIVAAGDFLQGRYFIAPEPRPATIRLFAESPLGTLEGSDGKRYRELGSSEFSYDPATGAIALSGTGEREIAAAYASPPIEVALTISGVSCARLSTEDAYKGQAQFDHRSLARYRPYGLATRMDSAKSVRAYVRDRATGILDTGYECTVGRDGTVLVSYSDPDDAYGTYAKRPFTLAMPWLYRADYGNPAGDDDRYAPDPTHDIVIEELAAEGEYVLDAQAALGSLEVFVNGLQTYAFAYDSASRKVTFDFPIHSGDRVTIRYSVASSDRSDGALIAGIAYRRAFGEDFALYAAIGTRWAVPGLGFSSPEASASGFVTATVGYGASAGDFESEGSVAASYRSDDSAGRMRIEAFPASGSCGMRPDDPGSTWAYGVEDEDASLQAAFPDTSASGVPHSLSIQLQGAAGAAFSLRKHYPSVPIYAYSSLQFYVRADSISPSGTPELTIALSGGSGEAIHASFSLSDFSDSWHRVTVRLSGEGAMIDAGNGESLLVPLSASFDRSILEVTTFMLEVSGIDSGNVRIALVDLIGAGGNFALASKADFSYRGKAESGPHAKAAVSAYASDSWSIVSKAELGWVEEAFGASLGATFALPSEAPFIDAWYDFRLGPPWASIRDAFLSSGSGEGWGHKVSIGAGLDSIVRFESYWDAIAWERLSGRALLRRWGLAVGGLDGWLYLWAQATLESSADEGDTGDVAHDWLASWFFFLPDSGANALAESLTATVAVGSDEDGAFVRAGAEATWSDDGLTSTANLRFGYAFDAFGMRFELEAARKASGFAEIDAGFDTIALDWTDAMLASYRLWLSIPLLTLFDPSLSLDTYMIARPGSSMSWNDGVALRVERDFGDSIWDLFVPAWCAASLSRTIATDGSVENDGRSFSLAVRGAAVNLFGLLGSYPLGLPFEIDRYRWGATFTAIVPEFGAASFKASHTSSAAFTSGPSSLECASKFSLVANPDGIAWSERIAISFAFGGTGNWLSSLIEMAIPLSEFKPYAPGDSEDQRPKTKDSFSLECGFSDASDDGAFIEIAESYRCSYLASEYASAFASIGVLQEIALARGTVELSFELEFGVALTF